MRSCLRFIALLTVMGCAYSWPEPSEGTGGGGDSPGCPCDLSAGLPAPPADFPEQRRIRVGASGATALENGQALQAALVAAEAGDHIVLTAGASYEGPFELSFKQPGAGGLTIRSDKSDALGARCVHAVEQSELAHLVSNDVTRPVFRLSADSQHVRIAGLDFAFLGSVPTDLQSQPAVVEIGTAPTNGGPNDVALTHVTVRGRGAVAGSNLDGAGLLLNGSSVFVTGSRVVDFDGPDGDSEAPAIRVGTGSGPFVIAYNELGSEDAFVRINELDAQQVPAPENLFIAYNIGVRRSPNLDSAENPFVLIPGGKTIAIIGNRFADSTDDAQERSRGGAILLAQRVPAPERATEGLTIRDNSFYRFANEILEIGDTGSTARISDLNFENNLILNFELSHVSFQPGYIDIVTLPEGLDIRRNTFVRDGDGVGIDLNITDEQGLQSAPPFSFQDNVVHSFSEGVVCGTGACPASYDATFGGNIVVTQRPPGMPQYPGVNSLFPETKLFENYPLQDYRIASEYLATNPEAATKGADFDKLEEAAACRQDPP